MATPSPFDLVAAGRIHIAGGLPSTIPDVPICAVFLVFYVAGAAGNVTMFIRYGKRLKWQMALFGYCMSRITTMATRIAWSQHINNSGLAIASQVFLNAGVLLIFLVNLMMSKKLIFRTHYEYFEANPAKKVVVKKAFAAAGFLLLPFLALTITGAIQGFLTSDLDIQHKDTILKRVGVVAFFIYCTLPFFLVAFNALWRLRAGEPSEAPEKVAGPGIGVKSWQSNRTVWKNSAIILLVASLVTFEYGIKLAQGFGNATVDKWYYGKGAFYATSLLPETLAMFTLLLSNMPKRYGGLALMPLENKLEDRLEVEASEKGHSV